MFLVSNVSRNSIQFIASMHGKDASACHKHRGNVSMSVAPCTKKISMVINKCNHLAVVNYTVLP